MKHLNLEQIISRVRAMKRTAQYALATMGLTAVVAFGAASCSRPNLNELRGQDECSRQADARVQDDGGDIYHDKDVHKPYDGARDSATIHSDGRAYDGFFIDLGSDQQRQDRQADVNIIDSQMRADAGVPDATAQDSAVRAADQSVDGATPDVYTADASIVIRDAGADVSLPCPGEAPLNFNQTGICAGSYQQCRNGIWADDYTRIVGYQFMELTCDGLDNDCDISIDEGLQRTVYRDLDNDGRGNPTISETRCLGNGWVIDNTDCDDIRNTVYFGAPEVCDGLNNDCDGSIDESLIPPSQSCAAGVGDCQRSGLEYATCLGVSGWSTTYSGCDAVAGSPSAELCDGRDNDCDQDIDNIEIDHFNQLNQNGLGNNVLGNPWIEEGSLDDWDIVNNAAETTYTGGTGSNPKAYSVIGHRTTFDTVLKWRSTNVDIGGTVFIFSINGNSSGNGGLRTLLCTGNRSTHEISFPGGVYRGSQSLQPNIDYRTRFQYDGANLRLKIWPDGTTEPLDWLVSGATTDTPLTQGTMSITSDLNSGETTTISLDYIVEGCR